MLEITLPDGNQKSFEGNRVAVKDVVESLGEGWRRMAVAVEFDGAVVDLHEEIAGAGAFRVLREQDSESLKMLRHTASHVMAWAVQELYPGTRFAIGPAIADGFYYDFDVEVPFTPEDLVRIESKMKELLKTRPEIHREVWSQERAKTYFAEKQQAYKVELIEDLGVDEVSIYVLGGFTDLCAGPHLEDTRRIKNFKVLHAAGAYWRGDASKPMLQRIYATAFFKKKDLSEYITRLEEAEKRDHRKLGKVLDLFDVREEAGGGLVFWYPKGAVVRDVIEGYLKRQYRRRGYELVFTPHIAKADLWHTSGHYDYYHENMYCMNVDGQEYVLKPMNCPGHILVYKRRLYSYRDLPVRLAEMGTVYRRELSGTLHGMLRVRGFTQDDAHLFCTPEQVPGEVDQALAFAIDTLTACGFEEFKIELSVRDPKNPGKYAGNPSDWDHAEGALEDSVRRTGLPYERIEGEAVFYGPKIDIKVIDAIGRSWQLSTIQFDFNLPERFNITYVAKGGERRHVVMVHRALLGSIERFVGILTEHFAGAFPTWLSPVQVLVLPVAADHVDYAEAVRERLDGAEIRASVDGRDEKIGKRIREGELQKVPYMLIVGGREAESDSVSVRARSQGDLGSRPLEEFIAEVVDEANPKG